MSPEVGLFNLSGSPIEQSAAQAETQHPQSALAASASEPEPLDDRAESARRRGLAEFKLAPSFPDLDAQDAQSVRACTTP
jgi:hypothetical protein